MPKVSINELKQWFQTGDKPTQQQFYNWLESFVHKDDGIEIANVNNLVPILNSKADAAALEAMRPFIYPISTYSEDNTYYDIPVGRIVWKMIIQSTNDSGIIVEDEEGAANLLDASQELIVGGIPYVLNCDVVARTESKRLFFQNITGPTWILIYFLPLTPIG